jgi:hypothetical protein
VKGTSSDRGVAPGWTVLPGSTFQLLAAGVDRVDEPRIEPEYPMLAKQARDQGVVEIEVVIDDRGNVVQMKPPVVRYPYPICDGVPCRCTVEICRRT